MEQDGFTKIPNEILEEMARSSVFCHRTRILSAILRKTAGWNKKEDWISLSQFEGMTGIEKPNVCRALKQLLQVKIIIKSDNKYRINGITKAWQALSKMIKVIRTDKADYQIGEQGLSDVIDTKDTLTKNNSLQKKSNNMLMTENDFQIFWHLYPRKVGRKKAKEKFMRIEHALMEKILDGLKKQIDSAAWKENSGQFIPYPMTWLVGERWEDDPQSLMFSKNRKNEHDFDHGYVSTEGRADLIV